jgi:hypothetical protein
MPIRRSGERESGSRSFARVRKSVGEFLSSATIDYARLAVETGIFALKEAVDGVVTHT